MARSEQMKVPGTPEVDQEFLASLQRQLNVAVRDVEEAKGALRRAQARERAARLALGRLEESRSVSFEAPPNPFEVPGDRKR